MKIGMILEDYYPDDIRITKEAEVLISNGYEVYLLCMKKEYEKVCEVVDGITVLRVELPIKQTLKGLFYRAINAFIFKHFLWEKAIENFIVDNDIDVLHVHDLPLFGTANQVVKRLNKKIVIDFHENYPDGLQVWSKWKKDFKNKYVYPILSNYERWLGFEKIACEQSDKAIVVVPHMQKRLQELHQLDELKTYVVSNTESLAFETMEIFDNIVHEYKNKFVVSYIGGVGYHRGIDTTIKAFNQINNKNIYLLVVGGMDRFIKEHLENLATNKNIIFTGQVPFYEVPSYIQASNICLVPHNDTEHTNNTIPHKLFQYMLLKRPVIVSSCPPLKDVVDECQSGLVFQSNDYNDLKDKITMMYNQRDNLIHYGENGYKAVKEKYHFEKDGEVLLALYNSLENELNILEKRKVIR